MSKDGKDPGKDIIDKDGKIRFDKYQYDCDTYKTILDAVVGFDWKTYESNKKVRVEMSEGDLIYDDDLTSRQI